MELSNSFTADRRLSGTELINAARALATHAHRNQKDVFGREPYIYHVSRTVQNVLRLNSNADAETLAIAWLHDAIEDTDVTPETLRRLGFPETVIEGVILVSKRHPEIRSYEQRIDAIIASGNQRAMLVKLADNLDNMHPERAEEFRQHDPEGRAKRDINYTTSIRKLAPELGYNAEYLLGDFLKTSISAYSKPFYAP